jgi:WD repeat-containing protein 19
MMLGFSEGYFVVISTHMKEIGQELFSSQFFTSNLSDIAFSPVLQKTAICGDTSIKIVSVTNWKTVTDSFNIDSSYGTCDKLGWTKDGLILSVSTTNGSIFSFLTKVPLVNASYETKWARLSSLRSINISDSLNPNLDINIDVGVEPQFMALGPNHVSV